MTLLRRRALAPRAHFFWRFGYPVIVVAAAVAVVLLAREGGKRVLVGTVVTSEEQVALSPDEPGYLAFVEPTPTLLTLHTHQGELAGVTFMARTGIDAGGGIVLVSSDLYAVPQGAAFEDGEFLGQAYAQTGAPGVERYLEALLGFGFDEVIEVSSEALAGSVELASPLSYRLLDDWVRVGADGGLEVVYPAGVHELDGPTAAALYSFRNPEEADVNRLERQRALWESWLDAISRAEDPNTVLLSLDAGLWPFLRALSAGTAVVEVVPLQSVVLEAGAVPFYTLDAQSWQWLQARALELVPRPRQPKSFLRPRVQMLDATGDASRRDALIDDVVEAGGVVTVIGNAEEFGLEATRFAYHRPDLVTHPFTSQIAARLGVEEATLVELDERTRELADITITVGRDQAAQ